MHIILYKAGTEFNILFPEYDVTTSRSYTRCNAHVQTLFGRQNMSSEFENCEMAEDIVII